MADHSSDLRRRRIQSSSGRYEAESVSRNVASRSRRAASQLAHVPLLQPDPSQPTRRAVSGLPLWSTAAVTDGVAWGIRMDRSMIVVRDDVRLEIDRSAYFSASAASVRRAGAAAGTR